MWWRQGLALGRGRRNNSSWRPVPAFTSWSTHIQGDSKERDCNAATTTAATSTFTARSRCTDGVDEQKEGEGSNINREQNQGRKMVLPQLVWEGRKEKCSKAATPLTTEMTARTDRCRRRDEEADGEPMVLTRRKEWWWYSGVLVERKEKQDGVQLVSSRGREWEDDAGDAGEEIRERERDSMERVDEMVPKSRNNLETA